MCGHVPSQRGYLLHPVSSFFSRRGAAWSSRRESWVSSGSAASRGMAGFSCHLETGCLMLFVDVIEFPVLIDTGIAWHCQGTSDMVLMNCYVVRALIVFIRFLLLIMLIGAFNSRCLESRGAWCSLGLCQITSIWFYHRHNKNHKMSKFSIPSARHIFW